jgi:hypothetical protein
VDPTITIPPTPTTEWKPGQGRSNTPARCSSRAIPYVGAAKIAAGMYTPGNTERLKLSNEDRGDRSYKVADFELLPQTENIFVIFKDGWHPAEVVTEGAGRTEWQWTKKDATIAFRNPKRDVVLVLQVDNPAAGPNSAQQVTVQIGDQTLTTIPLSSTTAPVLKFPVTAAQLGTGDMVEMKFTADKTFVPALDAVDEERRPARELGARFFTCSSSRLKLTANPRGPSLAFMATDARAEIVVFKNGRTMSVKSCLVDAETPRYAARRRGSDLPVVRHRARRSGRSSISTTSCAGDRGRGMAIAPAANALCPRQCWRGPCRSDFHRRRDAPRRCPAGACVIEQESIHQRARGRRGRQGTDAADAGHGTAVWRAQFVRSQG